MVRRRRYPYCEGKKFRYATGADILSWEHSSERIGYLMEEGQYATKDEVAGAEFHKRKELAIPPFCDLHRDLSKKGCELHLLSSLDEFYGKGFPEDTARLADALSDADFLWTINAEFAAFREQYLEDTEIVRFRCYRISDIDTGLEDLTLPRREYCTEMAQIPSVTMFITEDELEGTITQGHDLEGKRPYLHLLCRRQLP